MKRESNVQKAKHTRVLLYELLTEQPKLKLGWTVDELTIELTGRGTCRDRTNIYSNLELMQLRGWLTRKYKTELNKTTGRGYRVNVYYVNPKYWPVEFPTRDW